MTHSLPFPSQLPPPAFRNWAFIDSLSDQPDLTMEIAVAPAPPLSAPPVSPPANDIPLDPFRAFLKGRLHYESSGNYPMAVRCFEASSDLGNPEASLLLAKYYRDSYHHLEKNTPKAIAYYLKALQQECAMPSEVRDQLGNLYLQQGDKKKAFDQFRVSFMEISQTNAAADGLLKCIDAYDNEDSIVKILKEISSCAKIELTTRRRALRKLTQIYENHQDTWSWLVAADYWCQLFNLVKQNQGTQSERLWIKQNISRTTDAAFNLFKRELLDTSSPEEILKYAHSLIGLIQRSRNQDPDHGPIMQCLPVALLFFEEADKADKLGTTKAKEELARWIEYCQI